MRDYVLGQPGALELVDRYVDLLALMADGYRREGKHYVTLAVGCTGGKHRSVVISEELGRRMTERRRPDRQRRARRRGTPPRPGSRVTAARPSAGSPAVVALGGGYDGPRHSCARCGWSPTD